MSPNSLFINILMDQQRNDTKSNTHAFDDGFER